MGILDRLLRPTPEKRNVLGTGSTAWLLDALTGGSSSSAGVSVTPENSLQYSAVLACVRALAEGVAQLPFILYERQDRGRQRATGHPLYSLLHMAPNPMNTSFEWHETMIIHLLLYGNSFAEIQRDGAGRTVAIWPLQPWRMTMHVTDDSRWYEYDVPGKRPVVLRSDQVLHIFGFCYDGLIGKGLIHFAKAAVGLGRAAEQYGSAFFSNGARPSVVLEHPGTLGDEAFKRLRSSWNADHQGLSNAQRMAILEEGMKLTSYGIPPEDAQFLETRKFQRVEVASVFRVPPHMIGDLERATFSNIEQQSLDFVIYTLQPWLVRIEQRTGMALLTKAERSRYYAEHLVAGLLRGDMASRYQSYATGRQWGWLSANDVRELENLNPVPGGDVYLVPMNMVATESRQAVADRRVEFLAAALTSHDNRLQERRATATDRARLAKTYQPTLGHTAQRVVNREVNDLRNAGKRFRTSALGTVEMLTWLRDWLNEQTSVTHRYIKPTLTTYAGLVQAEVEREMDQKVEDNDQVKQFTQDYIQSRANAWMARLRRDLNDALYDDEDPWDIFDEYLAKREDAEAERWSGEEVIRFGNALARIIYAGMGVGALVWMTMGESCAYCQALDGMTIEISEAFLPEGEELTPDGEPAFSSSSEVGHPPLHGGCDCMIVAG